MLSGLPVPGTSRASAKGARLLSLPISQPAKSGKTARNLQASPADSFMLPLPRPNGNQLIQQVRGNSPHPSIPVPIPVHGPGSRGCVDFPVHKKAPGAGFFQLKVDPLRVHGSATAPHLNPAGTRNPAGRGDSGITQGPSCGSEAVLGIMELLWLEETSKTMELPVLPPALLGCAWRF